MQAEGRGLPDELRDFVFDGRYGRDHADLPALLSGPGYAPQRGPDWLESSARSYRNMREVAAATGRPSEVVADVHRLCAVHEWTGVVDPAAAAMMSVHYNLCTASLLALAQRPEYVAGLLADLDAMRSVGLFLATEGTSGNNLLSVRTRARYDREREEFVLDSPDEDAYKIMASSALPGTARTGVVVAQLEVPGVAPSLHAFAVPLATADGPAPGVVIAPLSRGMSLDMDFGRTGFHGVRVPRRLWLSGPVDGDRDPEPDEASAAAGSRFWQTLGCLKLGRILLPTIALAEAGAALAVTVRYSLRRATRGGSGAATVPAMAHANHRAELMRATSGLYAATALMNTAKRRWAAGLPEPERTLVVNTVMLNATSTALEVTSACRERCGAQGLLLQNRISAYVGLAHGAVTAEGDNQVVAPATARQLMGRDPVAVKAPEGTGPLGVESAFSPAGIGALLDGRTEALLARARAVVGSTGHPTRFDAWNAAAPAARDAAFAHCEAEAYRSMLDGLERADGGARSVLESLTLHHGLTLLARHGAWHLAEGRLDPELWRTLHARIEQGDRGLAAHGTALVDAFGFDDDLLRVPIARA